MVDGQTRLKIVQQARLMSLKLQVSGSPSDMTLRGKCTLKMLSFNPPDSIQYASYAFGFLLKKVLFILSRYGVYQHKMKQKFY